MASFTTPDFATLLKRGTFKSMPWKNGQGQTEEIAISPIGARLESGNFQWRVSSATISAPGSFSQLPGYDRSLLLLSGSALLLRVGKSKKQISLAALEMTQFAGEEEVFAELPAGPVKDLNVIYKRGLKQITSVLPFDKRPRSFVLKAKTVFFVVAAGSFSASAYPGELDFKLEAGDVLRVDELPSNVERLLFWEPKHASGKIIAIEIG